MKALLVALAVVSALVLGGCATEDHGPNDRAQFTPAPKAAVAATIPAYSVVSSEDETEGGRARSRIKVVIHDTTASMDQVRAALEEAARSQGKDAVVAFGNWPGTDTNGAYTAGRLLWSADGQGWQPGFKDPGPDFEPGHLYVPSKPGASAARLSEAKRREIYYRLGAASIRASNEADARYPITVGDAVFKENMKPNSELQDRLQGKYEAAVRRRYRLSRAQQEDIQTEGATASWPAPQ